MGSSLLCSADVSYDVARFESGARAALGIRLDSAVLDSRANLTLPGLMCIRQRAAVSENQTRNSILSE